MGNKTGIEWTDSTWNPIVGCSIVSPGCTNCYAMKQAYRIELMAEGENVARALPSVQRLAPILSHYAGTTKLSNAGPVWTGKVALAPEHILTVPLHWKRPRRIFVNSMGDLFHESVPDEWIDQVFEVMARAPKHTFQILTKRSKRMREYMTAVAKQASFSGTWAPPNVWLGVSAERQQEADERVSDLLATPAAMRFVSAEPLLGPIDFTALHGNIGDHVDMRIDALTGRMAAAWHGRNTGLSGERPRVPHIDWIISGGESGPDARPMHPNWPRSIRDQCAAAGVAYFFKQWGEFAPDGPGARHTAVIRFGKRRAGRLLDGIEHNEMPRTI